MRFLLSIFCFLLCLAAHAQTFSKSVAFIAESVPQISAAGITFDTISTNIDGTAEEPENFTHTISTLSNGYIVVGLAYYDADPVTGVTFDGSAMTKLHGATNFSDTILKCELWGLAVGSKAAAGYTVSIAGIGTGSVAAFSASWNGVHQSASTGTAGSDSGISTSPAVTITSATSEVVVDIISHYYTSMPTVGASQTERGNVRTAQIGGGTSSEAGAASVPMTWTLGGTTQWVIAGVPLKPAS